MRVWRSSCSGEDQRILLLWGYCGLEQLCVAGMIFGSIGRESASYSIVGQSALEVTLYWVWAGLRSSLRRL